MKKPRPFVLCVLLLMGCVNGESPPAPYEPVLLAELQVWHGLESHAWPPYDSRDPQVISRQIDQARAAGISGFVIDWYGPADGAANDAERGFQDQAASAFFAQAEAKDLMLALLYDEGTVSRGEAHTEDYQARIVSDLSYARKYFSSDAYMRMNGLPAVFVFPYNDVEPHVDWEEVRGTFASPVTLIDKDPDPLDPSGHDAQFDGFFAWVTATNGAWDGGGAERGEAYLNWFYPTMGSGGYSQKITVGGVWPGFDDTLAPWHDPDAIRYMARRGAGTYDWSMALALQNEAPYILIGTWNDFEEGSDIEFGVSMGVDMDDASAALLIRSSPLRVTWRGDHPNPVLQAYKDCALLPTMLTSSGATIALQSEAVYELKLWADDLAQPLSRWVVIRHQDPVPGETPVVVDE